MQLTGLYFKGFKIFNKKYVYQSTNLFLHTSRHWAPGIGQRRLLLVVAPRLIVLAPGRPSRGPSRSLGGLGGVVVDQVDGHLPLQAVDVPGCEVLAQFVHLKVELL